MYQLVTHVDNTDLPVSLDALKLHLGLNNGTDEDDDLTGFIRTAAALFEKYTGRSILPRTFRQYVPALNGPITLMAYPVRSIDSVSYYDPNNSLQTANGWHSDAISLPAEVWFESYPSTSTTRRPVAYVTFQAGWDADKVPAEVLTAIKLLAGDYYENREANGESVLSELPNGFRAICDLYRTGLIGPWGM